MGQYYATSHSHPLNPPRYHNIMSSSVFICFHACAWRQLYQVYLASRWSDTCCQGWILDRASVSCFGPKSESSLHRRATSGVSYVVQSSPSARQHEMAPTGLRAVPNFLFHNMLGKSLDLWFGHHFHEEYSRARRPQFSLFLTRLCGSLQHAFNEGLSLKQYRVLLFSILPVTRLS